MIKKIFPGLLILLLLGVGGYFYFQKKASAPPVSPEVKKVQQEMLANCKYDRDFCIYSANALGEKAGGSTMTTESILYGKKIKMVLKNDGKGNTESTNYSDGVEEGTYISLNGVVYMKNQGETVWTEYPKEETGKNVDKAYDINEILKNTGNVNVKDTAIDSESANDLVVKKIGSEKCGVHTCAIFEVSFVSMTDSLTKIWVDTTDHYARKMESKTPGEGLSTIYFDYEPVTITKPSPLKKMPAVDSTTYEAPEVNVNTDETIPVEELSQ